MYSGSVYTPTLPYARGSVVVGKSGVYVKGKRRTNVVTLHIPIAGIEYRSFWPANTSHGNIPSHWLLGSFSCVARLMAQCQFTVTAALAMNFIGAKTNTTASREKEGMMSTAETFRSRVNGDGSWLQLARQSLQPPELIRLMLPPRSSRI